MSGMLYSHDAESSLIGAAMMENGLIDELAEIVRPEDFYLVDHRSVWGAIINLHRKGDACDLVTVGEHLEATGQLHQLGGYSGLAELARNTPITANAVYYAGIVSDLAQRRAMIERIVDIESELRNRENPLFEVVTRAKGGLEGCLRSGNDELLPVGKHLPGVIDTIDRRFNDPDSVRGLSTGIADLDDKLLGLKPGLYVVGARPSMGKTAMMLQFCSEAVRAEEPALVASLEMPRAALIERMMANIGNFPLQFLKDPKGANTDEHWPHLSVAVSSLNASHLYIDDKPGQTIAHIRQQAKAIYERHGSIGLVCIDYLQKMDAEGDYGGRYDRHVGEVIVGANNIRKEFDCPVVVLSQLNRNLESRANKRPVMSDLKESGVIEAEADVIALLYRDEYYNPDNPDNQGLGEIIIAKNREGEVGTVTVRAKLSHARFENLTAPSLTDY